MTNIIEETMTEAEALEQAKAQAQEATAASDDASTAEGGKRRKGPKQRTVKKESAAEDRAGGATSAASAEMPALAASRADGGGRSEEGEPGKPADDVLASYPNLAAWTVSAGPAPLRTHILTARALGMGAGTKRELAVAAYLRDEANQFTLSKVAEALRAVLGGEFNVQRNVVNGLQAGGLVKINKVTAEDGTSYRLELTAKGEARVNKWLAEHGHAG